MPAIAELIQQMNAKAPSVDSKPLSPVMICDGTNLFIRAFMGFNELNKQGNHVGGLKGFLTKLGSYSQLFKPSRIVVVFDGDDGSRKRKMIHPEYKAHRTGGLVKVDMFDSEEDEHEAKVQQMIRLVDYLKCLPVTIVCIDNVEADDVVAYYAQFFENQNDKVVIVSSDKDYLQLINDNITVYKPDLKQLYTDKTVLERYNISPKNFTNYLSLNGDAADGIAGVKGLGPKTIVSCYPELAETREIPISELIAKAIENNSKKAFEKISLSEHILVRNHLLIDLHHPMLSDNEKQTLLDMLYSTQNKGSYSPTDFHDILQNDGIDFDAPYLWISSKFSHLMV